MPLSCCCVSECASRGGHCFQKEDTLWKIWIIASKWDQKPGKLWEPLPSVVCFQHLESTEYIQETTHGNIAAVVLKYVSLILTMLFDLLFR